MPDFAYEKMCEGLVCGVDEVGRGPLAGPVVAAAVILDVKRLPRSLRRGLDDSKKLSAANRTDFALELRSCARIGLGAASVSEIDRRNILQASLTAMARAVAALGVTPNWALIDGNQKPPLTCQMQTIVGGDGLSLSIAAASVVAKVARDRLMQELGRRHEGYGWERNAGYGTSEHLSGLNRLGVTRHHRRSFAPVRLLLGIESKDAP